MENAILMASGMGTRMRPLTLSTPKPLVSVCGKPMIETIIEGLEKRQINHIYVVVGYLGDQFSYLTTKYPNVSLIRNPDYETVNNISSIYYARKELAQADCFVCEADLYVADPSILQAKLEHSCYYGKMVRGYSADWVFDQDADGMITRVGKEGTDCYNMTGIAFLQHHDAEIVSQAVEEAYHTEGFQTLFWDDVVNSRLDQLQLQVHPVETDQITEIDTVEELEEVNRRLRKEQQGKKGRTRTSEG